MQKRAMVTGANKGIGLEIARELGKNGYEIMVGARDESRGALAVEKLKKDDIAASFIEINLNDFSTLQAAAGKVGTLDILVNNAGIPGNLKTEKSDLDMGKSPFAYTTDELRQTMEVNFFGTHELIKNLMPNLATDAKIINVTIPVSGNFYWQPLAYKTSKAAQNAMVMIFGVELAKTSDKRQIFGVMPGATATDLNGETEGAHGGRFKSAQFAGKLIARLALENKNYNGCIINWDGTEIESYEPAGFVT
ncbi:MAG: SDR family NAD(P)-dependent oxidoreductase [Syntrophorhabdaceae bacterium]|nr:SDR family NAD(P)-dependent oxidoreductase [Syntrophorhabdaceae bacterium]